MAEEKRIRLRTIAELQEAHEWLLNEQRNGKIDAKRADGINTTLKGATYLNAKLKMDAAKLYLQAQIKKVDMPFDIFADIMPPPSLLGPK